MRFLYFTFILLFMSVAGASAQNKNEARRLFEQGRYEEAKPMFRALYNSSPTNSEYNYWYAVCCLETNDFSDSIDIGKMLEFAISRRIVNAYRYLGDYRIMNHDYVDAERLYSEYIGLAKNDSLRAIALSKQSYAEQLVRMVKNTEIVCFVDSFVVDEGKFLRAYRMGSDVGSVVTCAEYFDDETLVGYLNETERGLDIYFSDENVGADDLMKLYHSSKLGEEWGAPQEIAGFDTKGNDNYPFMLSDGVTLYFASDGEGSIGGYDLFVSRMDTETGRFFRPDRLGMPFNSMANDYMLAINEVSGLGWFATDRNQPDGKVCVYVFVYNNKREKYDVEKLGYDKVLEFSEIASIADTQTDENVMRKARQQLTMLLYADNMYAEGGDFVFVVDDLRTYSRLSEFKSAEARNMFTEWQRRSSELAGNIRKLDSLRDRYAQAAGAAKNELREPILQLEREVEDEYVALAAMELEIRRVEQERLYN